MSKERAGRIREILTERHGRALRARYQQLLQRCCTTSDWRLISPLDPDLRVENILEEWIKLVSTKSNETDIGQPPEEACRKVADAFAGAGEVFVFDDEWRAVGYIAIDADQLPNVLYGMLIENNDEVRVFDEKTWHGEIVDINDAEPPTSIIFSIRERPYAPGRG